MSFSANPVLREEPDDSLNTVDINGYTPLFSALKAHKVNDVKTLIKRGADMQTMPESGDTPPMFALELLVGESDSRYHKVDLLQLVLTGRNVNVKNKAGFSVLMKVAFLDVNEYANERFRTHLMRDIMITENADATTLLKDVLEKNVNQADFGWLERLINRRFNLTEKYINGIKYNFNDPGVIVNPILLNDVDTVSKMLRWDPNLNIEYIHEGFTPLFLATDKGNVTMMRTLVEAGANVKAIHAKTGHTILILFYKRFKEGKDFSAFLKNVLKLTKDVIDVKDKDRCSVLMYATFDNSQYSGKTAMKLIAEAGANMTTLYKDVAHTYFSRTFGLQSLQWIEDFVEEYTIRNHFDQEALCVAVKYQKYDEVSLILDNFPAAVNKRNAKGDTPLMVATQTGLVDMAALLIEKKAKLEEKDHLGKTALIRSTKNGRIGMVKYLLRMGADILTTDKKNETILMHVLQFHTSYDNLKPMLEFLVSQLKAQGADFDAQSKDGMTALMMAVKRQEFFHDLSKWDFLAPMYTIANAGADVYVVSDTYKTLREYNKSLTYLDYTVHFEKIYMPKKGFRKSATWVVALKTLRSLIDMAKNFNQNIFELVDDVSVDEKKALRKIAVSEPAWSHICNELGYTFDRFKMCTLPTFFGKSFRDRLKVLEPVASEKKPLPDWTQMADEVLKLLDLGLKYDGDKDLFKWLLLKNGSESKIKIKTVAQSDEAWAYICNKLSGTFSRYKVCKLPSFRNRLKQLDVRNPGVLIRDEIF
jgi:ankyrin repeat protein